MIPNNVDPTPSQKHKCEPSDAILLSNHGITLFGKDTTPIKIVSQDNINVSFEVVNPFNSSLTSVYTQYYTGNFGHYECLEEQNIKPFSIVNEYSAKCEGDNDPYTIVKIWGTENEGDILNEGQDDAIVPGCCHPSKVTSNVPTVMYTFKLPCKNPCAELTLVHKNNAPTK